MKVGSDDGTWIEEFRLRQLHGHQISSEDIVEERVRRARLRGKVDLTDSEWRRFAELDTMWRNGSLGVNDSDWEEWSSLRDVAQEWRIRKDLPLLQRLRQRLTER